MTDLLKIQRHKFTNIANSIEKKFDEIFRIFSLWLFGDVIFAVIPIATIALINGLHGDSFKEFLLLKEWSFASIVFFGVSIRKFIRLKVQVQQVPRSYKLDTGVQLYIALVIASVLVLSFVILNEKGALVVPQRDVLGRAQLILFILGIASILISIVIGELHTKSFNPIRPTLSKHWLLRQIISKVEQADNCLNHALETMERASDTKFADQKRDVTSHRREERLQATLQFAIERLEQTLAEGKARLEVLKTATHTNSDNQSLAVNQIT